MITLERLQHLLFYIPGTGEFYWRTTPGSCVGAQGKRAGWLDEKGYICIQIDGKKYRAHRLAWLYYYGEYPKGVVDHFNGKRHHNMIKNLRDVTAQENAQNRKPRKGKRYIGVSEHRSGLYIARIMVAGRNIVLGFFETAKRAYEAYKEAKRKYHPTSRLAMVQAA